MKCSTLIFIVFCTLNIFSQNYYLVCDPDNGTWNFEHEEDSSIYYISIDTVQENNIWAFGHAEKNLFITDISNHVLITDSVYSYPINNLSSFEFYLKTDCFDFGKTLGYWGTQITIISDLQSTYGMDGGMIEVSTPEVPWHQIISDDAFDFYPDLPYTIDDTVAALHAPGMSGEIHPYLSIWMDGTYIYEENDSIGFRFTFASDSIPELFDGWMIEQIDLYPVYEPVIDIESKNKLQVFPNPADDYIFIQTGINNNYPLDIKIINASGDIVLNLQRINGMIDLSALPNGIYLIRCELNEEVINKKFIITK